MFYRHHYSAQGFDLDILSFAICKFEARLSCYNFSVSINTCGFVCLLYNIQFIVRCGANKVVYIYKFRCDFAGTNSFVFIYELCVPIGLIIVILMYIVDIFIGNIAVFVRLCKCLICGNAVV